MKKTTILIFLILSCLSSSYGQQVSTYTFTQSTESYTPITGGTVLGVATNDDTSFDALSIGFTFNFNGLPFTQVSVNSNGFLAMGTTVGSSYTAISGGTSNNVVAALNGDIQGNVTTGELSYLTSGTAPNRVFTVQWSNYIHYNVTGDNYNFQIKLFETSNVARVVYGSFTQNATNRTRQVGLRGNDNTVYNNRTTTTDWSATTAGVTNTASCTLTTAIVPTSGLVFSWAPPAVCSGTPNPGNTLSSTVLACAGVNFTLSLQNTTAGSGVTYQWQTSPDGTSWTNASGITNSFTTSQTATTYYQSIVTCTGSSLATTSTPVMVGMNSASNCYCTPTYTFGKTDGDLISNIQIATTTLANNTGTDPVNPAYTYFTGLPNYTAVLQAGSTYNVTVSVGTYGGQHVSVWIDYNDDGFFATSERVGFTTVAIAANGSASFPISLACNPALGTHRMRVRDVWNTTGNLIDPCANYGYGETEDYNVTISAAVACPQPSALSATAITTNSANLTWNAGCVETVWDLHLTTIGGGVPTGAPSNSNVTSPFSATSLSPSTSYDFYVRADCSSNGTSLWTGPFTFTTNAVPPVNDDCSGAISLTVGENIASFPLIVSNISATASQLADPTIPAPTCSFYSGGDVWHSVIVPASGNLIIETNSNTGSAITDTGLVVYSGLCGALTTVLCDDDASLNGNFSLITLTGRTPGEVLYIRTFEYGNDTFDTFQVSAYDCPSTTPAPSGNASQTFCSDTNPTVASLVATGTAIQWYATSTGGTALLTTDVLVSGSTYFASQTLNCESFSRLQVTATITTNPVTPTGDSAQTFCPTASPTLASLAVSGTGLVWYDAATLGNVLPNTTVLTATTYYVASANGSCESSGRLAITTSSFCPAEVCLNATYGQYPAGTFVPNSANCDGITAQTITFGGWAGEYSLVSVITGQTYIFASSISSDVVTIGTSDGATAFTSGVGSVTWVSTISGDVRFYTHLTGCGTSTSSRERSVACGVISTDSPDYVNLQFPATLTFSQGGSGTVYGQVYEGGLTDVAPNIIGQAPGITAWVGISSVASNTNPNTWTNWVPATWNSGHVSNNDEYQATIGAALSPGTYYYATRFRLNSGAFVYGGIDSNNNGNFWDGTTYNSGVLTITPPPVPANDDCAGAIALTTGGVFADFAVTGTNIGATNSNPPAPGCANFTGADVWYSVTIPASGNLTIETGAGSLTDTGMAVYSGSCPTGLNLVGCNDDGAGNFYSLISLTGRTAGEILYVNVWQYGGGSGGTFQVSAYDASLGSISFDTANFSYYPNPVKNMLNLSYTQNISSVAVFNLLGQEVVSRIVNANQSQIDMSNLPTGTYVVKIISDNQVKSIKVIKE